jgi:sialate O-acetylesterase
MYNTEVIVRSILLMICMIITTFVGPVAADVVLPAVIGPNMVLQRGVRASVWGWADPEEKVTVKIADQAKICVADAKGNWAVKLNKMQAGGPLTMTVTGKNTIKLENILVGDVWVCSGQSNMRTPVAKSKNGQQEVKNAKYPSIRLFNVKPATADKPQFDSRGSWSECTPETVPSFSAVGYFFGRHLHKRLKVPVGLIQSAYGGTPAEAWTPMEVLQADDLFRRTVIPFWEKKIRDYDPAAEKKRYEAQLAAWKHQAEQAKAKGVKPRRPQMPVIPAKSPHRPAGLYNAMIAPLTPLKIRGVIWYQGECNAGRAWQYRRLLPLLIESWRTKWGQGNFPFLIVQLANYNKRQPQPSQSTWAELREAQFMALSVPNTALVVAIDIGEADDIHPRNKQDVGKRLALAARKIAYGEDICFSGPVYESMRIAGEKVLLKFKHTCDGLSAKGGGELKGFAIAGADRKFVWADAKIEGNDVVVWSNQVVNPVAVRYAWADNPDCNLYNTTGLPASPFRTDKWPGITNCKKNEAKGTKK